MADRRFRNSEFQSQAPAPAEPQQAGSVQQRNIITGITALLGNENSNTYKRFLAELGNPRKVERLFRTVTAIVRGDKYFDYCTPMSVLSAAMSCVNHHLELDRFFGQCAIVPFQDMKASTKKNPVYNAQLMVMRRGLIQISMRTHLYRTINVRILFGDEVVSIDWKTEEPVLREVDPQTCMRTRFESGEVKCDSYDDCVAAGVYGWTAWFVLMDGSQHTVTWPIAKVNSHGRRWSKPYQSDIRNDRKASWWSRNFTVMAEKTVLRNLILNWGPMTDDMVDAFEMERVAFTADGSEVSAYDDDLYSYHEGDYQEAVDDAAALPDGGQEQYPDDGVMMPNGEIVEGPKRGGGEPAPQPVDDDGFNPFGE